MVKPVNPEDVVADKIGRRVRRQIACGNTLGALHDAMAETSVLLAAPTDEVRHAIRRHVFRRFARTTISSYQCNDFESMDYELFEIAPDLPMLRGPSPSADDLRGGNYFCVIGAAQTFGRLVRRPFATVLSEALGLPVLNLSRAGAGPGLFLDPRLLALIHGARFVVLQVMSGRSAGCLDYPGGRTVIRNDGSKVHRWDVLQELWSADRKNAIRYVHRWNASYFELYRQLREHIESKSILLWFSERRPKDWSPGKLEKRLTWGAFPQLIGLKQYERVADLFDYRYKAVTGKTSEEVRSRVTGSPCPYFGDGGKKLHYANIYYPSTETHASVAAGLLPWARQALTSPPRRSAAA